MLQWMQVIVEAPAQGGARANGPGKLRLRGCRAFGMAGKRTWSDWLNVHIFHPIDLDLIHFLRMLLISSFT